MSFVALDLWRRRDLDEQIVIPDDDMRGDGSVGQLARRHAIVETDAADLVDEVDGNGGRLQFDINGVWCDRGELLTLEDVFGPPLSERFNILLVFAHTPRSPGQHCRTGRRGNWP